MGQLVGWAEDAGLQGAQQGSLSGQSCSTLYDWLIERTETRCGASPLEGPALTWACRPAHEHHVVQSSSAHPHKPPPRLLHIVVPWACALTVLTPVHTSRHLRRSDEGV